MSESAGRIQLGREPIPGDQPAGRPVADEADFEALRAEATKDPIHGPADWKRVVDLGSEILSKKSKDFVAASYLVAGLAREDGIRGLADGIGLYASLVETFWEQGFPAVPKRMRRRANAIEWMSERAAASVEGMEFAASDRADLERCDEALGRLGALLDEKMESSPGLGDLVRGVRTALERLPAPEPEASPAASPETAAGAPAAPAQASAPPTPAAAPAPSELVSKSDAVQWIFKVAGFFREKEPTNPIAFRLARTARWSEVGPIDSQGGQTALLPPPGERVAELRRLLDAGDWPGLLAASEEAFRERPLWIDAQRFADRALAGLGGPYRPARDAVALELRALLARVPDLGGLSFKDGTPLADAETREWIQSDVLSGEAGGAGAGAPAPVVHDDAGDPAELEAAREQAREHLRKKRLGEALRTLEQALAGDGSPRRRFLARLEIAGLCAEGGHDRLAQPLYEGLDEEIARHGLDRWEPELSVSVLRGLYRCRRRLADQRGAPPEARARADEVFARLCRIDPVAAASVE